MGLKPITRSMTCNGRVRLVRCWCFIRVVFVTATIAFVLTRNTWLETSTPMTPMEVIGQVGEERLKVEVSSLRLKVNDSSIEAKVNDSSIGAKVNDSSMGLKVNILEQQKETNVAMEDDPDFVPHFLPKDVCQKHAVKLIMCVAMDRANAEARKVIRETWGSYGMGEQGKKHQAALVFVVGMAKNGKGHELDDSLRAEAEKYGDIVMGKFVDSYQNLTLKSLSILRYVSRFCPQSSYLLKADDDMYINVPVLIGALERTKSERGDKPFVTGYRIVGAKPIRNPKNKWYAPLSSFKQEVYPQYVLGSAYSMTTSAALPLLEASKRTQFFWLEDVYITGMCRNAAGLPLVQEKKFTSVKRLAKGSSFKDIISGHGYNLTEMQKIHSELLAFRLGGMGLFQV